MVSKDIVISGCAYIFFLLRTVAATLPAGRQVQKRIGAPLAEMSKHSKWAKIKNDKGAADVKKGVVFTKFVILSRRRRIYPLNQWN